MYKKGGSSYIHKGLTGERGERGAAAQTSDTMVCVPLIPPPLILILLELAITNPSILYKTNAADVAGEAATVVSFGVRGAA